MKLTKWKSNNNSYIAYRRDVGNRSVYLYQYSKNTCFYMSGLWDSIHDRCGELTAKRAPADVKTLPAAIRWANSMIRIWLCDQIRPLEDGLEKIEQELKE